MEKLPHITVATVVPRQGKFLMVQEHGEGELVFNQPAGHLEVGETLQQAAIRETLEETGWRVRLTALLGVYSYPQSINGIHYLRHCFIAEPEEQIHAEPPDSDIERALWMSVEELRDLKAQLRSPMVLRAVDDYLTGEHYPLSLLK